MVNIQWSASDGDGDSLEINLFFRHYSDSVLNPIKYGLDTSGTIIWDTSGLDEGNYYLVMTADDGVYTSWKNVSVSVLHPVFTVKLDEIQVAPMKPTEGQTVAFYVIVSNIGNLDGSAEIVWTVDGERKANILMDLEKGEEEVSQFSWIATSGEHIISVSTGTAVKSVSIFVGTSGATEEEDNLNPWLYSLPIIVAGLGVVFFLRRLLSSDDEFEWE